MQGLGWEIQAVPSGQSFSSMAFVAAINHASWCWIPRWSRAGSHCSLSLIPWVKRSLGTGRVKDVENCRPNEFGRCRNSRDAPRCRGAPGFFPHSGFLARRVCLGQLGQIFGQDMDMVDGGVGALVSRPQHRGQDPPGPVVQDAVDTGVSSGCDAGTVGKTGVKFCTEKVIL